jgi:hypothetical protein
MTIRSEFGSGYRFKKFSGDFGLEIETEAPSSNNYPNGFFVQREGGPATRYDLPSLPEFEGHLDNSLRHFGMEFVFKEPLSLKGAKAALEKFGKVTAGVPFLKGQPSTSVHVHINMLNRTPLEMANFMTLYTLFESILVDYSGEARRSNLFALPIRVAEEKLTNIKHLLLGFIEGNPMKTTFSSSNVKYAALNVEPLHRIGSLEIRCFRGETNPEEILKWLQILQCLLDFASVPGVQPPKIVFACRDKGLDFFYEVFGDFSRLFIEKKIDIEVLMKRNLWYAISLASLTDKWDEMNTMMSRRRAEEAERKKTVKKTIEGLVAVDAGHAENIVLNEFLNNGATTAGTWGSPIPVSIDDMEEF